MSIMKKLARVAVAALLATGIAAGVASPSEAKAPRNGSVNVHVLDTGWP